MTKRLLSLFVCLSLLLSMIVLPISAQQAPETKGTVGSEEFEIVGEWIHGSDVYDLGADVVVDRCAKMGVTDIYLLVKGTGGGLGYLNTQFTDALSREDVDVLQETINAAHAVGIRVHAWLVSVQDELYKANNPDSGMWHFVRARDNANINPYDEGYKAYMATIATELASNYEIDGIHLDYIRYNHLCNGWSEQDFANLEAMGADVDRVKYMIRKTFYQDQLCEGEDLDDQYIFNAYRNGDPDALLVAEYRRQNVVGLAKTIIDAAKAVNPDLIMSAALMPEGGVAEGNQDVAFADLHYGQSYKDAAELYDYVCPMAYVNDYGKDGEWFAGIAQYAAELGNKVVMGTQAFYPATSKGLMDCVEATRALLPNENILGIIHFRHTQFGYAKFTYDLGQGYMDLESINTHATGYKWVIVEVPEGMTITGASYTEGFDAAAPITIAEDGRSVMLGYDPAEEGYVLPGMGEGKARIEVEGAPTDRTERVALARIYITNESRAYNVYEDLTKYTVTFVDYDGTVIATETADLGEDVVAPANPLRPGYRFLGWDTDFTNVSENLTVTATYSQIPQTQVAGDFEIVGEWVWGETVAELGADTIVDRCAKNGITDIYLLVKGTGGKLSHLKTQYTDSLTRTDRDVLQEAVDAAHAAGIRLHAWIVTVEDALYKANHPESGLWHYVRAQDNNRINPYDEGYQTYMTNVVTELVSGYDIDGIHLDYIRYNHLANGWSETDFANLEALGANIENVKYLINKTLYQDRLPEGETVDAQYIFNAYRNGDPDALKIAEYRRNNIVDFATKLRDAAKAANPDILFTGALMPEGGYTVAPNDVAFADLHYGQNYEDAVELYDYIVPMAYSSDYGQEPQWLADIAKYSVETGNKVVMGTQSYYPLTSDELMADIEAVRDLLPMDGILGIAHFRHSQFSYAKFTFDYNDGKMTVDIINTNANGYKWLIIEAAEGVKITGAEYGEGFNADAPIIIAEDGSSVMFGYDPAEEDVVLPGMGEGSVKITFKGAPTDPFAPVALARIYNINESRAYNVYYNNTERTVTFVDYDGTVLEEQTVAYGEAATTPENPRRAGYRFLGWDTAYDAVTEDLTVTATYREIPQSETYGDFEIMGEWVHGSTINELGADVVVDRCAKNGITDIYLLVKGTGGTLGYLKTQYPEALTRTNRDVLQETIDAAHAVGIRVHAWLCVVQDEFYKANNPDAGLWHYVRGRDNNNIAPYDEGYRTYMSNIAAEIAEGYDVDGIHFDYIRYNHLANGWSEQDFANLEAMGANIENVKYLINKTLYAQYLPEGEEVDDQYIFNAYRNGDPDAKLIAEYRRNNVVSLAETIFAAAKAVKPDLILSGALMPEGGVAEGTQDVAFADLHYGQNYEDAAELYTYICPMAYTRDYGQDAAWLAGIAQYAVEAGNKVVMGTQSYFPSTSASLMSEIEAVRDLLPNENILGIVHFRHSQFGYVKFNYSYSAGEMTVDVINTNATGYKWFRVDAAEGVTITGAEYGEGFDASAPIVIAEDGSYVLFGYDPEAEGYVLPGMGEGTVKITFEGAPAEYDDPVALGRIYITNESRSYNVYNDLSDYITVTFRDDEGKIIETQEIPAGYQPELPDMSGIIGKTFAGWDKAENVATGDILYTANFTDWTMPFVDVTENDWFYNDVYYAFNNGLVKGIDEDIYDPYGNTTRAMLVTILYRLAGSPSVEGLTTEFEDIIEGSWYYDAVLWGVEAGVVKGTSTTTFEPNLALNREQAATFLYRYAQAEAGEATLDAYPDADKVSEFAKEAMAWAVAEKLINGDLVDGVAYLDPQGGATRAQIAAILTRFCQR